MAAPPSTAEKPQQQAEPAPLAEKKAAASSKATPPHAPDPIELEIEQVRQAIREVQESKDPAFMAKPWRRRDLLVELDERIVELKRIQAQNAQAAAERARRAYLKAAWNELQPKRLEVTARWNAMRKQITDLLIEVRMLDKEHISKTDRRMLSENIELISLLRASFEVNGDSPVLVRSNHL